jgi:hypothetical protein
MHRMNWLLAVLATLGAWPAAANPIVEKSLFARPLGGCKVQVQVQRLRGRPGTDTVFRARRPFAFENNQCTQEVGPLKPEKALREESHDVFTFVDEVCANGTWHYRLHSSENPRVDSGFDFAPAHTVEVKGCQRKDCPERLEAPARVTEGPPRPPPCKVGLTMGHLRVGDLRDQHEPMGKILAGKDVIELTDRKGRVTVKGKAPGKAWVALTGRSARGTCAEFTVEPNPYKKPTLRAKKQWAYHAFEPGQVIEDVVVKMSKGERWTLPVSGTVRLVPYDGIVRMGVDAQCAPALYALDTSGYTGVMVTDTRGADHLYFVTLDSDPAELECRVISAMELMAGTTTRVDLPPVRVLGEDVFTRLPEGLVRGVRPGTAWLAATADAEDCMRVTVTAKPETQQARIDWVAGYLGDEAKGLTPTVVQLARGKERRLPFHSGSLYLSGMNDGVADFDLGTSTVRALNPGFTGFLLKDRRQAGKPHFIYVEVE